MYCLVISARGMSRMSRFWRRMRYSSRSSGPSNASRNTSSACGGMYRSFGSSVTGSPFTTAKGISTCSGTPSAGACAAGSLDATISSFGFICRSSVCAQMHRATHFIECGAGRFAGLVGPFRHDVPQELRALLEFLRAPAHRRDLLDHLVDDRLLAVETPDAGRSATGVGPLLRRFIRIDLVQVPHRTLLRGARIRSPDARRVRLHRAHFRRNLVRVLAQPDRIAVRLRHLATVEPRYFRRRGEQHLGLGQDRHTRAFEITEQPLLVRDGDAVVPLHERPRTLERLRVAALLILAAQLPISRRVAAAKVLHGELRLRLEIRLASVEMIEAARDLARDLDMGCLILTHRHIVRAVNEDVRTLQQRISEEAVSGEIFLLERLLLILVRRH